MFIRLSAGMAGGQPALGAALGAIDQFLNPAAARARELLDAQHERVVPTPSPGDRMLRDGRVTIVLPEPEPEAPTR